MNIKTLTIFGFIGVLCFSVTSGYAADQDQKRDQTQQQTQIMDQDKMIYGWELMTTKERTEHRAKMQSFKTEQERMAYREEHHKMMQERAKEKGVTLPDAPFSRGPGPGANRGFGGNQGSGGGLGGGRGR